METKRRATIRKHRWNIWRGYIGGGHVAEFKNSATETAEQAALRWMTAQNRPLIEHVKINCDDVVKRGLQTNRDFLQLYWDMQSEFGDKKYGYQVCLHEAAHATLMEQDGIKNVRYSGPAIVYDPAKGVFLPESSRVTGDDLQVDTTDDLIFSITCHMVAGGVAVRQFLNRPEQETGAERDFADFKSRYAAIPPRHTRETAEQFWQRAEQCVTARLDELEMRAKVLARTDEYLRLLYP